MIYELGKISKETEGKKKKKLKKKGGIKGIDYDPPLYVLSITEITNGVKQKLTRWQSQTTIFQISPPSRQTIFPSLHICSISRAKLEICA